VRFAAAPLETNQQPGMKIPVISLTALALSVLPLTAIDYTWIAPEPTVWQNGLAWTPLGSPEHTSDNATITGGFSHAEVDGSTITIGDITLDAGGQVSIFNGGELHVFNALIGVAAPGAVLNVSGPGALFNVDGSIFMGQNASDGSIQATGGATVRAGLSVQLGIDGSGTILLDDSTLETGQVTIANAHSAITLSGTSLLKAESLELFGSDNAAPGLVVNAGSEVQLDGASILEVATNTGAESRILLSGGSLTVFNTSAENVVIGAGGAGTANVQDGGQFQTGAAQVGSAFGSAGTVQISGTGSQWRALGTVTVGPEGRGELILQKGGIARLEDESSELQSLVLARDPGSEGTLSIGGGLGEAAAEAGTLLAREVGGGNGEAVVRFNHTATNYVFDVDLIGDLDVHVSAGVTTLGGANTFTGNILLDGGTLAFGGNAEVGDAANTFLFDGGALRPTALFILDRNAELLAGGGTFDSSVVEVAYLGVISGAGGLTVTGSNGAVLSPFDIDANSPLENTYSGGTTVQNSRLTVRYDTDLGAASGGLHLDNSTFEILLTSSGAFNTDRTISISPSGATIDVNSELVATFNGTISGDAPLVKTGGGDLVVDAGKAFLGTLDVQEGAVIVGQSGNFGAVNTRTTVAAGARFELPDSGIVDIGSLSGEGRIVLNGSQLSVYTHDDTEFSGLIEDGSLAGGSLVVHEAAADTRLRLSGANTYTGQTIVLAGTLVVDGIYAETADGSIFVADGAVLGGGGVLRGEATIDGIIAPGTNLGTLTIDNSVTWNGHTDNAWAFELGPGDLADLLVVGGDFLRGSGSEFVFNFLGAAVTGTFTLIDWDGLTSFEASDFSAINLAAGYSVASFAIEGSSLQVTVVPEPSVAALVMVALVGGLIPRRRGGGPRRRR
jgi:fibronectin-binding autotransporter adhesin